MSNEILSKTRISIYGNENWLSKLQAGILKSHGRRFVNFLLLQFNKRKSTQVRQILSDLDITSAIKQNKQTERGNSKETVLNCYLSYLGFKAMGVHPSGDEEAFRDGMAARKNILEDQLERWETSYSSGIPIHAMLAIANDDPDLILKQEKAYRALFGDAIKIISIEKGVQYKNQHDQTVEHFGYVDGISQPLFWECDSVNRDGTIKETAHWDPFAPLNLALVPDFTTKKEGCFGSYMVFRKLEQNVQAFKEAEHQLAIDLNLTGSAEEAAGAYIIGRFENGLPVVKFGSVPSIETPSDDNNFNYAIDQNGTRCPYHAHIRKTNPRGDNERLFGIPAEEERSRRIVRRGITYGKRKQNKNKAFSKKKHPSRGVGLLFICFQSSIANQFEFIQQNWANNNDFPVPFSGIDPIIGQGKNRKLKKPPKSQIDLEQKWRMQCGQPLVRDLSSFVTNRGGEYFYAPSLPFFKELFDSSNHSNSSK